MLNKDRTISFVFTALLLITGAYTQSAAEVNGSLAGTIIDSNGAVVAEAQVIATNSDKEYAAKTDSEGRYKLSLPPGLYRLKVERNGFCIAHRPLFGVKRSVAIRFDFELFVCAIANQLTFDRNGSYVGERDVLIAQSQEETFPLRPAGGVGFDIQLQYGERKADQSVTTYAGFVIGGERRAVIVSYNLLTICAETMSFDRERLRLRAMGKVIFDDGQQRVKAEIIEVDFKNGMPELTFLQRTR